MNKAVIILSIDDGSKDMYRLAKEVLMPYKVPATFNIITGSIVLERETSIKQTELLELAKCDLFEFANHSDKHTNEFDDIRKGFLILCDWLGYDDTRPMGFASPGSKMSLDYIRANVDNLTKHCVKYVRTCEYYHSNYFNKNDEAFAFTSYAVQFNTSVEELKRMADIAVENKYCLIYVFHRVLKKGEDKYDDLWSYDFDKFTEWLLYIKELNKQGVVDIMTTEEYADMQKKQLR